MSQKAEKPTLQGQRIKTRKRDERDKIKQDQPAFRDAIIQGLNEAGTNFEAISQFLDRSGNKLDYRRYAEPLFDVLFAGGLLAPGGTIIEDPDPTKISRTEVCVFGAEDEEFEKWCDVFWKLVRQYKYLEKPFKEEQMKKLLKCVKGYTPEEQKKLAKICALFFSKGLINAQCLVFLQEDNLVKEGLALKFATDIFNYWQQEKECKYSLKSGLKNGSMDGKLMNFFPSNKQTTENFERHFKDEGLDVIVEFQRNYENNVIKKKLSEAVVEMVDQEDNAKDIAVFVKEQMKKSNLIEHEIVVMMWNCIMKKKSVEWNKKEERAGNQALVHLKAYAPLLEALATSDKSELQLLLKIQEFCYDNMNFMKQFQKIVILLYKSEVLGEDTVKRWYKNSSDCKMPYCSKGLSVFLVDMKTFIDWLESAEEESSEEESGSDDEEK